MSLTTPAVNSAQFVAVVQPSVITPLTDTIPIALPMTFANVASLRSISGTYTPNNDTKNIATFLSAFSPSFIIFICDAHVILDTDNSFLSGLPVNKFFMTTMVSTQGGANPITTIYLNGMTSQNYPMEQGVPVSYTLIVGQADIT